MPKYAYDRQNTAHCEYYRSAYSIIALMGSGYAKAHLRKCVSAVYQSAHPSDVPAAYDAIVGVFAEQLRLSEDMTEALMKEQKGAESDELQEAIGTVGDLVERYPNALDMYMDVKLSHLRTLHAHFFARPLDKPIADLTGTMKRLRESADNNALYTLTPPQSREICQLQQQLALTQKDVLDLNHRLRDTGLALEQAQSDLGDANQMLALANQVCREVNDEAALPLTNKRKSNDERARAVPQPLKFPRGPDGDIDRGYLQNVISHLREHGGGPVATIRWTLLALESLTAQETDPTPCPKCHQAGEHEAGCEMGPLP